jgi:hypothetical protein
MHTTVRTKAPATSHKSATPQKKPSRNIKTRKSIKPHFSQRTPVSPSTISSSQFSTQPTPPTTSTTPKNAAKQAHKAPPQSTAPETLPERVVFESPLSKKERFVSFALTFLPVYTSLQCVTATVFAPEMSIGMPLAIGTASAALAIYRWMTFRRRVTEVRVTGPQDPITVSVPNLLGISKKKVIDRSLLMGVPDIISTKQFIDAKVPFILFVNHDSPYFLKRDGLFDSSGVLDSILGYDVITFERCPPSDPYDAAKVHELQMEAQSKGKSNDV